MKYFLKTIPFVLIWGLVLTTGFFYQIPLKLIFLMGSLATMITMWANEDIPQWIPSLIPFVILVPFNYLPLLKVLSHYFSPTTFLFFGGMILAKLIEHHHVHQWFFQKFIIFFERSRFLLLLGVLAISTVISSFISNTATALLMFPLILQSRSPSLMLAMGYGASLGGLATIVGSPTNAIMINFWNERNLPKIHFVDWIKYTAPLLFVGFLILFVVLAFSAFREENVKFLFKNSEQVVLGKAQLFTLAVFLLFVVGWMISTNLSYFPNEAHWSLIMATVVIFFPFKIKSESLFPFRLLSEIDYSILLLFGAGLAFADALQVSGLIQLLSSRIDSISTLSLEIKLFSIVLLMILFTEISSNTAAVSIFVPLFAELHQPLGLPLFNTLIAVTAAASLSFMLPSATPPNAIVFSSRLIKLKKMIKIGFILNLVFAVAITFWALKIKLPS